ncbi:MULTISPECIES: PadR family transcriptional regulator [Subtercola]|uniref:PadR family transcriptional regulator n=1 Tax=Subtercola vilae TaxID=2056433 RepID=A0A4T2C4N6_9MICO|nr:MULTISPECIES: PadR family transcriptional regulator [Subtercola]MEA9985465.1 PadR family transcriptional regulator [Subtercola sp. RTI3]TIH39313.1 PadR family transcriptional regulator [Subtercola vilae]
MSSIRLFILGSLSQHGEMHGHQLRLLAEEEHVHLWTDISVGALYGAIKRLAAENLIEVVRVEREGNFPERQVYGISTAGLEALTTMRFDELSTFAMKPDPFDLALTRLDRGRLDELPQVIQNRLQALRELLHDTEGLNTKALPYLSLAERFALNHREHRLRAEVEWHEGLVKALPEIVDDERVGRAVTHTVNHERPHTNV